MNTLNTKNEPVLALSITDQYEKNKALIAKPVSYLAKMAGLNVNDVYEKLLVGLCNKDIEEAIKYADTAIRYGQIVDRNRFREEVGEAFLLALEFTINIIKDGIKSAKPHVQRKAIMLHGTLIDESAEKQRFIESFAIEERIKSIAASKRRISELEQEVIEFEKENGTYIGIDTSPVRTAGD